VISEGSFHDIQSLDLDFTKLLGSSSETLESNNECHIKKTSSKTLCQRTDLNRQVSINSAESSVEEVKFSAFQETPVEIEETRSSGRVSSSIFASYFSAGGTSCQIFCSLFICIFTQILASGGDFWMAYW